MQFNQPKNKKKKNIEQQWNNSRVKLIHIMELINFDALSEKEQKKNIKHFHCIISVFTVATLVINHYIYISYMTRPLVVTI